MFRYLKPGLLLLLLAGCNFLYTPPTFADGMASASGPLALSPDGQTLWVVNPDADSVTPVNTQTLQAGTPIAVGKEPWGVAVSPLGVVVLNRADGSLTLLQQGLKQNIPIGPEPGGVALSPSGRLAYATVSGSDEIAVVDLAQGRVTKRIAVGHMPWAIAVSDDGDALDEDETIIVSHRLARLRASGSEGTDDGKEGWLSLVRGEDIREVSLPPYSFGFVNAIEGLAIAGDTILVSHLLNQPQAPTDFQNTVSAAVSAVSLNGGQELGERRIHLNESSFSTPVNFPRAVAVSPDARTAYVVLAGNDAVMGIDLSQPQRPRLLGFWPSGNNPRGVVLNREGSRAYVMNYLSRDVSVLDISDPLKRSVIARVRVVPETLEPSLLQGKILFNNASDPRLSRLGWMSCGSCHLDGGVDGTTWQTPDGPRQTQPLWKLEGTAPFHASATRDEVQDGEVDIERLMEGVGLAMGAAMPELGQSNANRSAELDSLASFVLKGIRVPRAGGLAPQQEAHGREVFVKAGCPQCHSGPHWTISALPSAPGTLGGPVISQALREVGTLNPADVLGQQGFDVPTLLGLNASAPYLHDGSAQTLHDVLANLKHAPSLTESEVAELVQFLRSLDDQTRPIEDQ